MIRKSAKITLLFIVSALCVSNEVLGLGFFPINFFRPWDINLRPPEWCGAPLQLTGFYEGSVRTSGYSSTDSHVNALQIWTCSQDTLAMLKGFPENSPEAIYFNDHFASIQDDNVRGHLVFTGNLDLLANTVLCARYHVPHNITVGFFLPVLSMKLKNVEFCDLTQNLNSDDETVKTFLTNNFLQVLNQFDPTLDLTGWKRTGVGDAAIMAEWLQCFPQNKEYLKNVGLNVRAGITIPTGLNSNIDQIFSVPFGFDGAWGIFFGGGVLLNWFNHIRGGVDFEFITLFGDNRTRRIKTQIDQTDFLLLAKTRTHLEYGFTQRYNLFLEAFQVYKGLSASVIYQYWKHGDDRLALYTNEFSEQIANSAVALQEWTIHQFIFKADYDFQCDISDCSWFKPHLQIFYKMPFNGTRSIGLHTVGFGLTFNF